jgi:hypothetical protein
MTTDDETKVHAFNDLPAECRAGDHIQHALLHLISALNNIECLDTEHIRHDLEIAKTLLEYIDTPEAVIQAIANS